MYLHVHIFLPVMCMRMRTETTEVVRHPGTGATGGPDISGVDAGQ